MKYFFSTLGKFLCVLISIACIAFLIYMNINDRTLEQQAADEVAAVNEDAREAEKELAQAEAESKAEALREKEQNDSFYRNLKTVLMSAFWSWAIRLPTATEPAARKKPGQNF